MNQDRIEELLTDILEELKELNGPKVTLGKVHSPKEIKEAVAKRFKTGDPEERF